MSSHVAHEPEDWEDWEDNAPTTPTRPDGDHQQLLNSASSSPSKTRDKKTVTHAGDRTSTAHRVSVGRIKRLKSRQRQKAQNAKAGITLVTDMSQLRRPQQHQHIAQQLKLRADNEGNGKFVDAAALRALEGSPNSASVGSFNWLRKKMSQKTNSKKTVQSGLSPQDLSPNDRPIVIGIEMPSDDLAGRVISPATATTISSAVTDFHGSRSASTAPTSHGTVPLHEQRSVWSPDTDDGGISPHWTSSRVASSVYSQGSLLDDTNIPSVPAIPQEFKASQSHVRTISDPYDGISPITLFEEDGSPVTRRKSTKRPPITTVSPMTSRAPSQGWWDQVMTPFTERPSPATVSPPVPAMVPVTTHDDRLPPSDEKRGINQISQHSSSSTEPQAFISDQKQRRMLPTISITGTSSAAGSSSQPSEKEAAVAAAALPMSEQPPPYSPPSRQHAIRYRAVFPTGHPLNSQYPPSPGPVSPAIQHTMTSQRAIELSDVPLTPAPVVLPTPEAVPMPDRPMGTFVPGDHFQEARGRWHKTERRRRRHEKEDALARKVGGFWKGRGCLPKNGCYGRSGREGRKKRRTCCSICCGAFFALILIIALAVGLTRHHALAADMPYSIWLNTTDFPPMPTGVFTVMGPDNSEAESRCSAPDTLWSCSLPKELQAANGGYAPNRPNFIFQIQFDNDTQKLWDTAAAEVSPHPTPVLTSATPTATTSVPASAFASAAVGHINVTGALAAVEKRAAGFASGINPDPTPPSFQDNWFLGNWTDGIVADNKGGEPTPFYMSVLASLNDTVGPNMLTRRGLGNLGLDGGNSTNNVTGFDAMGWIPPPFLKLDGSGADAIFSPRPKQQPVRLYDRGLPTEHYGFYTYFNKTIYVTTVDVNTSSDTNAADINGGCRREQAQFVVTFLQMRFLVQVWTRLSNTTQLIGALHGGSGDNSTQPGSFPYPVTVTIDDHGGNPDHKASYYRPVDQPGVQINASLTEAIHHDIGFGGVLINHPNDANPGQYNPSLGGMDGGTGGCKCGYTNFVKAKQT
jgi:hypothetical protein